MSVYLKNTSGLALIALLATSPAALYAQADDASEDGAAVTQEAPEADPAQGEGEEAPAEGEAEGQSAAEVAEEAPADGAAEEAPAEAEMAPAEGDAAGGEMAEQAPAEGQMTEEPAKQVEGQIVMQSEDEILATELMGSTVYSQNGESVGDISDMLINLDGTVEGVVIGVGGFLGIGEKLVAIEIGSLSVSTDEGGNPQLLTSATRADLEAAEAFVTAEDQQAAEALQSQPATGMGTGMGTGTGAGTGTVAPEN